MCVYEQLKQIYISIIGMNNIIWLILIKKRQQDALFLSFVLVKHSTFFGQIYCPSIGPAFGICHTSYVDCLLARSGWNCCEYSVKTPDDGQ
jgi:hypothetical protein